MRIRGLLGVLLLAGLLAACRHPEDPKQTVFIPAEGYACGVQIHVPAEAFVGEWVPLKASRTSGPWRAVKRSAVPEGTAYFLRSLPPVEEDVEGNVNWLTDPPKAAQFDLPTIASSLNGVQGRKVQFAKPGVYKIWAQTAYPTAATSNVETITIRPR